MTRLLHWAVQHSDPETLKEVMRKYKDGNLTLKDVYGQDVWDALFTDEAGAMKQLIRQIADFRNASVADGDLQEALERLQEFIEQVDNAGNLHRMGGLAPLLELSTGSERPLSVRAHSLWTLGVATQNNPPVQEDLLSLGGLEALAALLPSCNGTRPDGQEHEYVQFCSKLLFAISAMVKNSAPIQAKADALGVFAWLLESGARHPSLPVAKKALGVLETVLAQNGELQFVRELPLQPAEIGDLLLAHVRGDSGAEEADTDVAEKALRLINRLLALRPLVFPAAFQQRLSSAAATAKQRCERGFSVGEELCEGLAGLASHADFMMTARDIADEEL